MRPRRSIIGVASLVLFLDLGAARAQPPGAGNHAPHGAATSPKCGKGQSHCPKGPGGSNSPDPAKAGKRHPTTTTTTTSGPLYRAPSTTTTTSTGAPAE